MGPIEEGKKIRIKADIDNTEKRCTLEMCNKSKLGSLKNLPK